MALEENVSAFLSDKVMIIATTRDDNFKAHIGRGCGAYFDDEAGDIVLLVSSSQWPDFFACAVKGSPIAVTFAQPSSYKALQIKGQINHVAEANSRQQDRASRYIEQMLAVMAELGVNRLQLSTVFAMNDLAVIRFWPADLFVQTPGPRAGELMEKAE